MGRSLLQFSCVSSYRFLYSCLHLFCLNITTKQGNKELCSALNGTRTRTLQICSPLSSALHRDNHEHQFSTQHSSFHYLLSYIKSTGVTLFALVLRLNCTAPSQSESSNFFMYSINDNIKFRANYELTIIVNSEARMGCSLSLRLTEWFKPFLCPFKDLRIRAN